MTGSTIRPGEHDRHERLLVVRLATNDELDATEGARARALVAGCPDCAALAVDVKAISRATAASLTPSRPRDFSLSPEQAAAAHGSRIRRWLGGLTSPGMGSLRPLAGAAVALGLLLVVAGGGLPGFGGASQRLDTAGAAGSAAVRASQEATTSTPVMAAAPYDTSPASTAAAAASAPPRQPVAPGATMPSAGTDAGLLPRSPRPQPDNEKSPQGAEASGQSYEAVSPGPSDPPKVGLAGGATAEPTAPSAVAQPTSEPVAAPAPAPTSVGDHPDGGSPLALFGLLLGIVGLAVLGLTWVARRATKDHLLR